MDNSSGVAGEEFASDYLRKHGFEILRRNFHSRFGEIDIIARDGRYLAFVEVKTREADSIVDPLEAVTAAKQRKIIRTAQMFLQQYPEPLQPRFDVAAITARHGVPQDLRYLENAFSAEGFV
jgi:putative endonuclease